MSASEFMTLEMGEVSLLCVSGTKQDNVFVEVSRGVFKDVDGVECVRDISASRKNELSKST